MASQTYLPTGMLDLKGGKTSVGRVINKCVTCQSLHKNPPIQRLGDLPEDRVKMAAPFQTRAISYDQVGKLLKAS